MKRILLTVLCGALLFGVAACNSSSPSPSGEAKKLEGDRIPKGAGPGAKPHG